MRRPTVTPMDNPAVLELPVRGRFDLAQSIGFGFGGRAAEAGDGMRMAFVLDGYRDQVAVSISQPSPDRLDVRVWGEADPERVVAHAARVLSVDVDATGYDRLVDGDPVLSRAYAKRPGLRPPLFYSAYEALAWSVLSARRPVAVMRAVRERLSARHGRVFEIDGRQVAAFPTPAQLMDVSEFPGIPQLKLDRMRTIAEAALTEELDTETLRAAAPDTVEADLQRFSGIGPFYAELVTIRALGHTDVLTRTEGKSVVETGRLLGRPDFTVDDFAAVAERWRPWRTWATVAIRAAA